jgi:hypothetical protein
MKKYRLEEEKKIRDKQKRLKETGNEVNKKQRSGQRSIKRNS